MSEWIECNLPWICPDYTEAYRVKPTYEERRAYEKKLGEELGYTFDSLDAERRKIYVILNDILPKDTSYYSYTNRLNNATLEAFQIFEPYRIQVGEINQKMVNFEKLMEEMPKDVAYRKLALEADLSTFVGKKLNKPGTLVEFSDGKCLLIGDMLDSGVTKVDDDHTIYDRDGEPQDIIEEINGCLAVKRYKVLDLS